MADLRDYQAPFFAIHKTLSKMRTSAKYQQIRAMGADFVDLRLKEGLIERIEFSSSKCIRKLAAEKSSSSWRVGIDFATEFGDLSAWNKTTEHLIAGASTQSDPRPAFAENPKVEELTSGLSHYDPEIAQSLAPVVFHHAFQMLGNVLNSGFKADCRFFWSHGGHFWNGDPMTFAWNDANGFYFGPQTAIDSAMTFYHPEYPHLKRSVRKTSYRLNDIPDLAPLLDELTVSQKLPLLTWSAKNVDRIVFMPSAVAPVVHSILQEILKTPGNYDKAASYIQSGFELADAPDFEQFGRSGIIDALGCAVQPLVIAAVGRMGTRLTAKNGHSADDTGRLNIYAPVLRSALSSGDVENVEWTPAAISKKRPGKVLFVEKTQVLNGKILLPQGGVLFHEGRLLGHVVMPPKPFETSSFFKDSRALGNPIRCSGIATCGAEMLFQ